MTLKHLPCAFMLTLLLLSSATAQLLQSMQRSEGATTDQPSEARQKLEKKALALLDEIVAEAQTLKLAENRVRIQSAAANLLWTRDEKCARTLFKEAMDNLSAIASNNGESSDPQYYNTMQMVLQLRQEMLQQLAQLDPGLALDFLRSTRQPPPQYGSNYKPPDQELMMELNLANQIAANDPKQALQIAHESLAQGVSSGLIGLLQQVKAKDREMAMTLVKDITKQLQPDQLAINQEAIYVAVELLNMARPREASHGTAPVNSAAAESVLIDEQTHRELMNTIITAALNTPANRIGNVQNLFTTLQSRMAEVEKYAPTQMPALRRKMSEFERSLDPHFRVWKEYEGLMQTGSVDSLLEAAAKAPQEMRDQLFSQATWKAFNEDGMERAQQIISNISNPYQRAQMLKDLARQNVWRAAQQGKIEEARQAMAQLTSPNDRVSLLTNLATSAATSGDPKAARQLLEEARRMVSGRAENQMQFSAQLQIAQAYASLDPSSGFEIIEGAIDHLNELLNAAAVVDGFGQESFHQGELKPLGGYMWNELINQCARGLATLAPADFDRARSAAFRFQRPEARLMAGLLMSQGLLSNQAFFSPVLRRTAVAKH